VALMGSLFWDVDYAIPPISCPPRMPLLNGLALDLLLIEIKIGLNMALPNSYPFDLAIAI